MKKNILDMKNITKEFSGVKALDKMNLTVREGDILSLCGENGAGKSTLMKVLSGIYPYGTYSGEIIFEGKEIKNLGIKDSESLGIAIIHQELNLIQELSILENLFLGNFKSKYGVMSYNEMYKISKGILNQLNLNKDPLIKIKDLGVGEQQLVEIGKALLKNVKLLILDEPTAPLTNKEVEILFEILKDLKAKGVTCIYISHKLNEVMELSDQVAVIRDGKMVGIKDKNGLTQEEIIKMMVGRELNNLFPYEEHEVGEVILEVKNFNVFDIFSSTKYRVKDANFNLRKGEILGIAGLIGAGRTELVSSIYGSYRGNYSGEIVYFGEKINIKNANEAVKKGIAMVPEDRKKYGIVGMLSVKENMSLSNIEKYSKWNFFIKENEELKDIVSMMKTMKVKAPNIDSLIKNLSGGNQQKVVIGKNLLTLPKILILDEPTRGIDVGAKYEIYKYMFELVNQGISIIMISSELPEVLGLSDRVMVMHEGEVKGILENTGLTQEKIMETAIGG
ncbi:xylose ABC transporter ATP-binding protein [Cetobacterium sp. 8H]|nr:xylose ABC transporter ATP-binding protein [Cetobacterium sp. 8H]MBC2850923.1 xylose ABC transporter ATP-binding protein [Cetobacterium sp. 8H]